MKKTKFLVGCFYLLSNGVHMFVALNSPSFHIGITCIKSHIHIHSGRNISAVHFISFVIRNHLADMNNIVPTVCLLVYSVFNVEKETITSWKMISRDSCTQFLIPAWNVQCICFALNSFKFNLKYPIAFFISLYLVSVRHTRLLNVSFTIIHCHWAYFVRHFDIDASLNSSKQKLKAKQKIIFSLLDIEIQRSFHEINK